MKENKQSKPSPIGRLNVNQAIFNDLRNTIYSFPVRKKGGKKTLNSSSPPAQNIETKMPYGYNKPIQGNKTQN